MLPYFSTEEGIDMKDAKFRPPTKGEKEVMSTFGRQSKLGFGGKKYTSHTGSGHSKTNGMWNQDIDEFNGLDGLQRKYSPPTRIMSASIQGFLNLIINCNV